MKRTTCLALLVITTPLLLLNDGAAAMLRSRLRQKSPFISSRVQVTANAADQARTRVPLSLPDFDIRQNRRLVSASETDTGASRTNRSLQQVLQDNRRYRLQRARPSVRLQLNSLSATPGRLWSFSEPLSDESGAAAGAIALRFITQHDDLFRLDARSAETLRVTRQYRSEHNGLSHVTVGQQVTGIDVFQSAFTIHIDRQGRVLAAAGELFPDITAQINTKAPKLTAADALKRAVDEAGGQLQGEIVVAQAARGAALRQRIDRSAGLERDVDMRLVYFPLTPAQTRLAWELTLWMSATPDVYLMVIDAEKGSLLYRQNLTCHNANPLNPHGLVWTRESPRPNLPYTKSDPPAVEREDRPFRAEPFNGRTTFAAIDRHYDWWSGQPATGLTSNNTDTYLDRDETANAPDLPRLSVPDGDFTFTVDLTQPPTIADNQKAAQANLFYHVNRFHDILYSFGFTEGAGNFQNDNYGLGGVGGDVVRAEAQDGGNINNASFATPPDGSPARMQMYLWSGTPQLDGAFDQGVIIHELTHGLSNRLVGNATGLVGLQARGMGEGWSDWFGLVLLAQEGDDLNGSYPVGQYITNDYGLGVRRFPYGNSMSVFPLTFRDVRESFSVHDIGEIWCNTLWEMRALLINKYGFSEGQRQSIQLVVDGLKLTPVSPTFIDARNAILLADRVNNGGANQCLLWQAFARRGIGFDAVARDTNDLTPVESPDNPSWCSDLGTARIDRSEYVDGEQIRINFGDRNATGPVILRIISTVSGDQENLRLVPEPGISGSYKGAIRVQSGRLRANDGILQGSVDAGDKIEIEYDDADNGSGSPAKFRLTTRIAREMAVFSDEVETGNQGWVVSGAPAPVWGITGKRYVSPARCWTDSPAGNYVNRSDVTLTSRRFDLQHLSEVVLSFSHRYDLEEGFDYGLVEFSTNGLIWTTIAEYTGAQTSFSQERFALPQLNGAGQVHLRFRLSTDISEVADGWYVDDIVITARSGQPLIVSPGAVRTPTIGLISPAYGSPAGGTTITILGSNFTTDSDTSLTFDGIAAARVQVLSASVMQADTPSHASGPVSVRLRNGKGEISLPAAFTYHTIGEGGRPPRLTGLWPASGAIRGGTMVTLSGADFSPETIVTFGAQPATVSYISPVTLRVMTPAGAGAGPVDVKVTNSPAQAMLPSAFTYTAPTPPAVRLTDNSLATMIYSGSTQVITWQSSDDRALSGHRISLLDTSGQKPRVVSVVADEAGPETQSWAWQVPAAQTLAKARLSVVAVDDEGSETEVLSDEFSLQHRWESVAPLTNVLRRHAVVSDGKHIYAIGGQMGFAETTGVLQRLDPAGSPPLWTAGNLAPLPTALSNHDAAVLDGKIYVPGGMDAEGGSVPTHQVYDIATNQWSTSTAIPVAAWQYAVAADQAGKVYYVTGGRTLYVLNGIYNTVRAWSVSTGQWTELPQMSTARYAHEALYLNRKLYVAGGVGTVGGLSSAEVYDFATGRWSAIAPLSSPRAYATSALAADARGNPLWIISGGTDMATGQIAGIEIYDIQNDRWMKLDNSFTSAVPRSSSAGVSVNGYFYMTGGGSISSSVTSTTERIRIDRLVPVAQGSTPSLAVPAAQTAIPGNNTVFTVTATDFASALPLQLTATGLPDGASLSVSTTGNLEARGIFSWTPAAVDVGRTINVIFSVSNGQHVERKQVSIKVAEAGALTAVSAADFRGGQMAADSIGALFGAGLAQSVAVADALPLPYSLAGTEVTINGIAAPLFFVSPGQINFAVPPSVTTGRAVIIVRATGGRYSVGTVDIVSAMPSIFTANSAGSGDAAALATADGISYQVQPFDVMIEGRPNYLILFGTGIRRAQSEKPWDENGVAESASVTIDGVKANVLYAGSQDVFSGLDQLNIEIPAGLAAGGGRRVEVIVEVSGIKANTVTIQLR